MPRTVKRRRKCNYMTFAETEKLILDHAADFRLLLDQGELMAVGDGWSLSVRLGYDWCCWKGDVLGRGSDYQHNLPRGLAIAAFVESWRDRLEKEHGVVIQPIHRYLGLPSGWTALHMVLRMRSDGLAEWLTNEGSWTAVWQDRKEFQSAPEALCAAAYALAEEKRKGAKSQTLSVPLDCAVCGHHSEPVVSYAAVMPQAKCPGCGTPHILCRWGRAASPQSFCETRTPGPKGGYLTCELAPGHKGPHRACMGTTAETVWSGPEEHHYLRRWTGNSHAAIGRLPTYADTGKPFIPGLDKAWLAGGIGIVGRDHNDGNPLWITCESPNAGPMYEPDGPAYSTEEASRARACP